MSKQFIVEMNDTEYCAIKATPEKYKTLAHKILERGTLVKTGHWIEKDGFDGDTYYDCSECGESFCLIDGTPTDNLYNYCPNCGAKMEGENE